MQDCSFLRRFDEVEYREHECRWKDFRFCSIFSKIGRNSAMTHNRSYKIVQLLYISSAVVGWWHHFSKRPGQSPPSCWEVQCTADDRASSLKEVCIDVFLFQACSIQNNVLLIHVMNLVWVRKPSSHSPWTEHCRLSLFRSRWCKSFPLISV